MKRYFWFLLVLSLVVQSCEFKLKPNDEEEWTSPIEVMRYDRLESRYLITGDFSALQQMNIDYPIETRTLVEKMLQIGTVDDPEISRKFLRYYQDSVLQTLVNDVEAEYANMDDINKGLNESFHKLQAMLPGVSIPKVYAQIGALAQSVVVGEKMIGISLDKYMGSDYPIYLNKDYSYTQEQLSTMTRRYIVPDCMSFYLLSLYPMTNYDSRSQMEKDLHMGKVMWTVNKTLHKPFFNTSYVQKVDRYMHKHPSVTVQELLEGDDYSVMM